MKSGDHTGPMQTPSNSFLEHLSVKRRCPTLFRVPDSEVAVRVRTGDG